VYNIAEVQVQSAQGGQSHGDDLAITCSVTHVTRAKTTRRASPNTSVQPITTELRFVEVAFLSSAARNAVEASVRTVGVQAEIIPASKHDMKQFTQYLYPSSSLHDAVPSGLMVSNSGARFPHPTSRSWNAFNRKPCA
jgi:hypothetical protein